MHWKLQIENTEEIGLADNATADLGQSGTHIPTSDTRNNVHNGIIVLTYPEDVGNFCE